MLRARHLPATLAAAAAALALTACGQRAEPTGDLPPTFPATVRGDGDAPVRVDREPRRIVAVDRGSAELLLALGVDARLVGVPAGTSEAPAGAEVVVSANGEIDVPRIAALAPDLVVATPASDQVELARIEAAVAAPVYLQPARSVDDVVRATLELGAITGEPIAARRLASAIRADVAEVESRVAGQTPVRVLVDLGALVTPGDHSLAADLVRRAAGTLVPEGDAGGTPLTEAAVAAAAPGVYLATSTSGQTLAALRARPTLAGTPAVRDGRFAIIPADVVDVAGPGIARGLEAVAAAIHPDAFR